MIKMSLSSTTPIPLSTTEWNTELKQLNTAPQYVLIGVLGIVLLTGFVTSIVLIITIVQSKRLRRRPSNLFIVNLAAGTLLDSLLNLPLVLASVVSLNWGVGRELCTLNAAALQFSSTQVLLALMLLALDRAIAAFQTHDYLERLPRYRTNILILYCWLHPLCFMIPILANTNDSLATAPAANRFSCSLRTNAPDVYTILNSIISYMLPLVVALVLLILVARRAIYEKKLERQRIKDAGGGLGARLYASNAATNRLWREVRQTKTALIVFVLWCVLQGPFLLLLSLEQWSTDSISIGWKIEVSFMWMRLSSCACFPLSVLLTSKDILTKLIDMSPCKKNNVADSSNNDTRRFSIGDYFDNNESPVPNGASTSPFKPTVIFATENGLHMHRERSMDSEISHSDSVIANGHISSNPNPRGFRGAKQCDVHSSRDFLHDESSDFDSENESQLASSEVLGSNYNLRRSVITEQRPPSHPLSLAGDLNNHNQPPSPQPPARKRNKSKTSNLEEFDSKGANSLKDDDELTVTRVYGSKGDLKAAVKLDESPTNTIPAETSEPVEQVERSTDDKLPIVNGSNQLVSHTEQPPTSDQRKLSYDYTKIENVTTNTGQESKEREKHKKKKKKKKHKKIKVKDMATSPIPLNSFELQELQGSERLLTPPEAGRRAVPGSERLLTSPEAGRRAVPGSERLLTPPEAGRRAVPGSERLLTPPEAARREEPLREVERPGVLSRAESQERPPPRLSPLHHHSSLRSEETDARLMNGGSRLASGATEPRVDSTRLALSDPSVLSASSRPSDRRERSMSALTRSVSGPQQTVEPGRTEPLDPSRGDPSRGDPSRGDHLGKPVAVTAFSKSSDSLTNSRTRLIHESDGSEHS